VRPLFWVNRNTLAGGLLATLLLSGCASTPQDCDPSNQDAGILNKAGCVYGGHYEQRIEERQTLLLDAQKTNQLFQATYDSLQQESGTVAADLASQQASLDRAQNQVGALLAELKAAGGGNRQLQQQIAQVESQLQQMQQTMADASASGSALPVLQQRQQMAELQLQVQDLQASLNLR